MQLSSLYQGAREGRVIVLTRSIGRIDVIYIFLCYVDILSAFYIIYINIEYILRVLYLYFVYKNKEQMKIRNNIKHKLQFL